MKKKLILFLAIIFIFIMNIYNYNIAESKQDMYEENAQLYSYAEQKISNGEPIETIKILNYLLESDRNNFLYNLLLGIAYANTSDWEKGLKYYKTSLDINPYLVQSKDFMLNLTKMYIQVENYENAKKVINRMKKDFKGEEISQQVEELENKVDLKRGDGNE